MGDSAEGGRGSVSRMFPCSLGLSLADPRCGLCWGGGGEGRLYRHTTYIRPRGPKQSVPSKKSHVFAYNSNSKRNPQCFTTSKPDCHPRFLGLRTAEETAGPNAAMKTFLGSPQRAPVPEALCYLQETLPQGPRPLPACPPKGTPLGHPSSPSDLFVA